MPNSKDYYCSECLDFVDRTHWTEDKCPSIPAAWFYVLENEGAVDIRHTSNTTTTTACMSCPRKPALARLNAKPIAVGKGFPMAVGRLIHSGLSDMGKFASKSTVTEACSCPGGWPLPSDNPVAKLGVEGGFAYDIGGEVHHKECGTLKCTFDGTLGGFKISGRTDAIRTLEDGSYEIIDYKNRDTLAEKFAASKNEDSLQAKINIHLAQQSGLNVIRARVVTLYWKKLKTEVYLPEINEDAILEARPSVFGGAFTIRDILARVSASQSVTSVDNLLATVSPLGEMTDNKWMCNLCKYDPICHSSKYKEI